MNQPLALSNKTFFRLQVVRCGEPYLEEFSIVCTGISLDAGAISCKQEVECFPVGAAAALAYILPQAIREEQAH